MNVLVVEPGMVPYEKEIRDGELREMQAVVGGRITAVYPYKEPEKVFFGSSDVGDVSQVAPCAQLSTACFAQGTPNHTWMIVSQAAAPLANKAALHAGKVIGCTAIDLIDRPELVREAKEEFDRRTNGVKYVSLLPADNKPPVMERP